MSHCSLNGIENISIRISTSFSNAINQIPLNIIVLNKNLFTVKTSDVDPKHFTTDPDPTFQ
jgi:hypothetical protein